ncbi:hypothetical protein HAZT_HAZT008756 [Hyalella azteca]|uniref:Peptidase aspartic putative domain-containing protein n=1 Tax=Hyalella azteca TaxID=294128 RepID=A0A6A0GVK6_HYAAZ|nr:hypothetical protein HAZT_HAZT008756 [Hyalella azteca]
MCPCCKKNNHHLANCFFFKKPTAEKMNIVQKLGLCFGCLRAHHLSKDCRNRLTCAKCGRQHPTVLHETVESNRPVRRSNGSLPSASDVGSAETRHQGTSFATGAGACPGVKVRCPVIPAKISLDNNIKIVVNVALDPFSTNCWINESLIEKLGAKTVKQDLYLTTMACKNLKTPTLILNNLKICDLDETVTATVPVLYSKPERDWPFSKEDLPRREDLEGLPFLESIPFSFLDEEVSVLIGMDMPGLLKTLQTVSREWNDPFASRHWLGWALNGPISSKTRKVSVHRARIHFKENEINGNFKKMFQDYDTTGEDAVYNSVEDDMFLEIVTANSKIDDDNPYVIDLPLKTNAKFPNNRDKALKRFKRIEKKFTRNKNYLAEYSAPTNEHPLKFNDEEFGTLMCEVDAILSNRPLTPVSDNPDYLEARTPNHLHLLNAGVTFLPGLFCKSDVCSKKRWKQVKYLADLLWTRWRR